MNVHHAPSVVYPVRHSPLPAILAGGAWLGGLALFVMWPDSLQELNWRRLILACLLVAGGAGIVWGTRKKEDGWLHWDGATWLWEPECRSKQSEALSLMVLADLQLLIVVRLTFTRKRQVWFGVHHADFPKRWLDFRRAIHLPGKTASRSESSDGVSARALVPVAALELVVDPNPNTINQ